MPEQKHAILCDNQLCAEKIVEKNWISNIVSPQLIQKTSKTDFFLGEFVSFV